MYCYTCLNTIELAFNSCMFFLYNIFILSNLNIYFHLDVLLIKEYIFLVYQNHYKIFKKYFFK